jgi:hypothetical protein
MQYVVFSASGEAVNSKNIVTCLQKLEPKNPAPPVTRLLFPTISFKYVSPVRAIYTAMMLWAGLGCQAAVDAETYKKSMLEPDKAMPDLV